MKKEDITHFCLIFPLGLDEPGEAMVLPLRAESDSAVIGSVGEIAAALRAEAPDGVVFLTENITHRIEPIQ